MEKIKKERSAHLILDKPLTTKRMDILVPATGTYRALLARFIIDPGAAYIPLVNGEVADLDGEIQAGDEIRAVAQIVGG